MRIAIVEDERVLAQDVKEMLKEACTCDICLYTSGEQFLFELEENAYDLIFMDIQMPGINGLQTAQKLREVDRHVPLVFLTNDPSFVFDGYEVDAVRYWLKPVQKEKLSALLADIEQPKAYVLWSDQKEVYKLYEADIYYLESEGHYVICHHCQGVYRKKASFREECAKLSKDFMMTHRSYCVNLTHVYALKKEGCLLDNQDCIPISRAMKAKVEQAVMERCKEDIRCRF